MRAALDWRRLPVLLGEYDLAGGRWPSSTASVVRHGRSCRWRCSTWSPVSAGSRRTNSWASSRRDRRRTHPDPVVEVAGEDGRGGRGPPGRGLPEREDQTRQRRRTTSTSARVAAIREVHRPDFGMTVDANQAYLSHDAALELCAPPRTLQRHRLRAARAGRRPGRSGVPDASEARFPIEADEAADSLARVREILDRHAAHGVSIKIPKLGGIDRAAGGDCGSAARQGCRVRMGAHVGSRLLNAAALELLVVADNLGEPSGARRIRPARRTTRYAGLQTVTNGRLLLPARTRARCAPLPRLDTKPNPRDIEPKAHDTTTTNERDRTTCERFAQTPRRRTSFTGVAVAAMTALALVPALGRRKSSDGGLRRVRQSLLVSTASDRRPST